MKGLRIGYIRVSADDQNPERQLQDISLDKKFIDKASGKDTNRPQFMMMMDFIREGDVLIVHSLDRLARNLRDLIEIVQTLIKRRCQIQFIKESLLFNGDDSPMSMLLLSVMGAFAEFERAIIKERQMEGIAIAKKKGLYHGKQFTLSDEQLRQLIERSQEITNKSELAREFGISRASVYNYLKRIEVREKLGLK